MDNLRKEAKRWLKAIRANDPDARTRLDRAYPNAPATPVLRDVQHALAREHGFDNWVAMKTARDTPAPKAATALTREGYERLADDLLLCKLVSDDALSALPHFPSLKKLTPIDVTDPGFRHVGRCEQLVSRSWAA